MIDNEKSYKSSTECIVGLVAKMERKNLQYLSCADTLANNEPLKLKAL